MIAEIVKKLKPFLSSPDKNIVQKASYALSQAPAKKAFADALGNFGSLKIEIKLKILMQMKTVAPARYEEFIEHCFKDEVSQIRAIALKTLAEFNDPRFIEKALPLAKDPSPSVRKLCYEYLGRFPLPKLADILNPLLSSEQDGEALAALLGAVGNIGNPSSLQHLFDLLDRNDNNPLTPAILEAIGNLKF